MKSIRPARRGRRQRGDGILESALVLLALTAMIIFVMDVGRLMLIQQFITERAQATVRAAAVNNWDAGTVANYLVYNSTTAPGNGIGTPPSGYLGLQTSQVSYTVLGTAGTPDYRLQVKVSGVALFTWVPGMAGQYTAAPVVVTMPAQSLGAAN